MWTDFSVPVCRPAANAATDSSSYDNTEWRRKPASDMAPGRGAPNMENPDRFG